MQCRLYSRSYHLQFIQVACRYFSSSKGEKVNTCQSFTENLRPKWYRNGINRPLLPGTKAFEKRNIFLMLVYSVVYFKIHINYSLLKGTTR